MLTTLHEVLCWFIACVIRLDKIAILYKFTLHGEGCLTSMESLSYSREGVSFCKGKTISLQRLDFTLRLTKTIHKLCLCLIRLPEMTCLAYTQAQMISTWMISLLVLSRAAVCEKFQNSQLRIKQSLRENEEMSNISHTCADCNFRSSIYFDYHCGCLSMISTSLYASKHSLCSVVLSFIIVGSWEVFQLWQFDLPRSMTVKKIYIHESIEILGW